MSFSFFVTNSLLGVGLAMDAFSVSLVNGLNEPNMKTHKTAGIASVFALFQFAMPMVGWICVSTVAQHFKEFEKLIPWIALILLGFIGGKMLYEAIKSDNSTEEEISVTFWNLILQGTATSIDALSVGFTISNYKLPNALLASFIIGTITFFISITGILIGKKAGTKLKGKAGILGGIILISIGIKIFFT